MRATILESVAQNSISKPKMATSMIGQSKEILIDKLGTRSTLDEKCEVEQIGSDHLKPDTSKFNFFSDFQS